METEKLVHLDPSDILVRDNIRFALKPYRIDRLAEDILKDGGVNTPIEVQKLSTAEAAAEGKEYVLVAGHYRHAAVTQLNKDQAGITLPARVILALSDRDRVLRQISENNERENLSPLDKAIAMRRLIDAGVSKLEIRNVFAAPGGRKGLKIQPASNSHVNMTLSFLDFPKDVQRKIHDGLLPVGAAYELSRYPRDKWQAILDRVEADRIKAIDSEEKEEEKLLKSEKEVSVREEEVSKIEEEYATVAAIVDQTMGDIPAKKAALDAAFEAKKAAAKAPADVRKAANERFKAAENELKSAEKTAEKTAKELAALAEKKLTHSEKAQAARKRLEAARNTKTNKTAAAAAPKTTSAQVKKAAVKTGAADKPQALNANGMREAIKSLVILSNIKPKTKAAGQFILDCFDGKISDGKLQLEISKLMGEEKAAKK